MQDWRIKNLADFCYNKAKQTQTAASQNKLLVIILVLSIFDLFGALDGTWQLFYTDMHELDGDLAPAEVICLNVGEMTEDTQ